MAANQAESLGLLLQRSLKENAKILQLQEEREERHLKIVRLQQHKAARVHDVSVPLSRYCTWPCVAVLTLTRAEVKYSFVSHGF